MSNPPASEHLYLCSSVRHVYLAIGIALLSPAATHHLVLVGQKSGRLHSFCQGLVENPGVFASFEVLHEQRSMLAKYFSKRGAMKYLGKLALKLMPAKVFVGNDRRVEFQYVMFTLRSAGCKVEGVYIDDGTGSYLNGRYMSAKGAFTDRYFDRPAKKLLYGSWCERVPELGATQWVDCCYLNFPELAPEVLKQKQIVALQAQWYKSEPFLAEMRRILSAGGQGEKLDQVCKKKVDALLILPSKKFVSTRFANADTYNQLLNGYLGKFNSVAVKYHPRETDFYYRSDKEIVILPADLPAEVLFSFIEVDYIVGDLSSAVLSAVWLFPDKTTVCLLPKALPGSAIMQLIERTAVVIERI